MNDIIQRSDERFVANELNRRARRVMPGGNTRLTTFELPLPIYAAHGEGFYIHDVDGRRFVDFVNNYTTLLHGHAFGPINEALAKQMSRGLSFGVGTEHEIALAELIVDRIPGVDTVRFANSGTEAVMYALKAARAFTGKSGVARCEGAFHGGYDWAEVSGATSPAEWGNGDPRSIAVSRYTPRQVLDDVVAIPFNDTDWTSRILADKLSKLGAILVDPVPSRMGMIPMTADYAAFLNTFCRKHGILLISDEVLCNRISFHGASDALGLEPDLITLGKIIGGGLPIGAVGGRHEVMSVFDPSSGSPPLPHSGTFTANPMTMVAGYAAMTAWTPDAVARLNALGQEFRDDLTRRFQRLGARASVTGIGSLFKIHPKAKPPNTYRENYPAPDEKARLTTLLQMLRGNGFMLMSTVGGGCLSTPMTTQVLREFADVVEEWAVQDRNG